MRNLRKNKFVILITCVIIISLVYIGVKKAIDNYVFSTNNDIVTNDKMTEVDSVEHIIKPKEGENLDEDLVDNSGQISTEETNLVLDDVAVNGDEQESVEATADSEKESSEDNSEPDGKQNMDLEENKIYVYITGEVNNPGVVILNEGSRIVDAINAAGGTTARANVSKVNLVYILDDGMKVNIPNDNDLKNNSDFEYITMNSGDGGRDDYFEEGSSGEKSLEMNSSESNSVNYKNYSVVNINTATQTELETLPGIGPSLALKIINYRKENGKFSSIDEIKNVGGIGEKKFEELRSYIII